MDFNQRQAYFGLFDGYHCYGPHIRSDELCYGSPENHMPCATCHGHNHEVLN